jgi:hypothetical protein
MRILRLAIPVLMFVLWGCSSHENLEPPDNPFDPGNPDYVSPEAEIISGPGEGDLIDTTGVTFTWQGNETATEYSYQFDGSVWSDWIVGTSADFDYLDEGNHSFSIQARSLNGDSQATMTVVDFSVDAVAGPSAMVYPYRQKGSPGDTLVYQIIAEEVTDLFAVECDILINTDYLELIEIVNGKIVEEWGGDPLVIEDITLSSASISMVSVESTNNSFSGTTSIISIVTRVKVTEAVQSAVTVVEISEVFFLKPDMSDIDVGDIRVGMLDGI